MFSSSKGRASASEAEDAGSSPAENAAGMKQRSLAGLIPQSLGQVGSTPSPAIAARHGGTWASYARRWEFDSLRSDRRWGVVQRRDAGL